MDGSPKAIAYGQSASIARLLKAQKRFRAATRQLQSRSAPQSLSRPRLPDNFYLVQQTCRQIREDMPASFYRQLPGRDAGPLPGYPRIYAVAQKLIVMRRARLDLAHITRFVQLYQNFAPLTTGELWALPVMLRLGLVEFLAQSVSAYRSAPGKVRCPLTLPRDHRR
jgi:cyclic beta-1,2-glucan synthetase